MLNRGVDGGGPFRILGVGAIVVDARFASPSRAAMLSSTSALAMACEDQRRPGHSLRLG